MAAVVLLTTTLALHLLYVYRWTFDSDEWQHLHVAWAWTQGLLQYRDVFDNHTPLFHMLTAPIVRLFGETPDILFDMRLAMTPLFLATLAGSAAIASGVGGARAALWTPLVLAAVPIYFFRSIEYRTDALWVALWVWALAVLIHGRPGGARAFRAGLLLGLAVCTSLKTLVLLFALAVAAVLTPAVVRREQRGAPLRRWIGLLLPAVAGMLVPVVALLGYFTQRQALGALVDGAIRHNILPGLGTWEAPWRKLLFVPLLGITVLIARLVARRQADPSRARRLAFLALTAGTSLVTLQTLWPLFTTYDLLIFYPVAVPVVVIAMLTPAPRARAGPAGSPRPAMPEPPHAWRFAVLALALLGLVMIWFPPGREDVSEERDFLAQVLRLTDPGDYILDQKGDAIFRRRPVRYVMEKITRVRLDRGLLPEHIQEDMIATGTCVVAEHYGRFPARTKEFVAANFLSIGHVLVAGKMLPARDPAGDPAGTFEIAVPGRYALVGDGDDIHGSLDGLPYDGPRHLDAGPHTFTVSFSGTRLAVIWAQAVERGFSPFPSARRAS
jgi:hypothetical protein